MIRRQVLEAPQACLADAMQAEPLDWPVCLRPLVDDFRNMQPAVTQIEGCLDRIGDALAGVARNGHAVDDNRHVVLPSAIHLRDRVERMGQAVHTHSAKSLRPQAFPEVAR